MPPDAVAGGAYIHITSMEVPRPKTTKQHVNCTSHHVAATTTTKQLKIIKYIYYLFQSSSSNIIIIINHNHKKFVISYI
jgi:hypothetical protein